MCKQLLFAGSRGAFVFWCIFSSTLTVPHINFRGDEVCSVIHFGVIVFFFFFLITWSLLRFCCTIKVYFLLHNQGVSFPISKKYHTFVSLSCVFPLDPPPAIKLLAAGMRSDFLLLHSLQPLTLVSWWSLDQGWAAHYGCSPKLDLLVLASGFPAIKPTRVPCVPLSYTSIYIPRTYLSSYPLVFINLFSYP